MGFIKGMLGVKSKILPHGNKNKKRNSGTRNGTSIDHDQEQGRARNGVVNEQQQVGPSLFHLIRGRRWAYLIERLGSSEGGVVGGGRRGTSTTTTVDANGNVVTVFLPEIQSFDPYHGDLPLHRVCYPTTPPGVLRAVLHAYPEASSIFTIDVNDATPCGIPQYVSTGGYLPIHRACLYGCPTSHLGLLLAANPSGIHQRDRGLRKELPLHMICRLPPTTLSHELLKFVLERYPEGVWYENRYGHLPLRVLWDSWDGTTKPRKALLKARGSQDEDDDDYDRWDRDADGRCRRKQQDEEEEQQPPSKTLQLSLDRYYHTVLRYEQEELSRKNDDEGIASRSPAQIDEKTATVKKNRQRFRMLRKHEGGCLYDKLQKCNILVQSMMDQQLSREKKKEKESRRKEESGGRGVVVPDVPTVVPCSSSSLSSSSFGIGRKKVIIAPNDGIDGKEGGGNKLRRTFSSEDDREVDDVVVAVVAEEEEAEWYTWLIHSLAANLCQIPPDLWTLSMFVFGLDHNDEDDVGGNIDGAESCCYADHHCSSSPLLLRTDALGRTPLHYAVWSTSCRSCRPYREDGGGDDDDGGCHRDHHDDPNGPPLCRYSDPWRRVDTVVRGMSSGSNQSFVQHDTEGEDDDAHPDPTVELDEVEATNNEGYKTTVLNGEDMLTNLLSLAPKAATIRDNVAGRVPLCYALENDVHLFTWTEQQQSSPSCGGWWITTTSSTTLMRDTIVVTEPPPVAILHQHHDTTLVGGGTVDYRTQQLEEEWDDEVHNIPGDDDHQDNTTLSLSLPSLLPGGEEDTARGDVQEVVEGTTTNDQQEWDNDDDDEPPRTTTRDVDVVRYGLIQSLVRISPDSLDLPDGRRHGLVPFMVAAAAAALPPPRHSIMASPSSLLGKSSEGLGDDDLESSLDSRAMEGRGDEQNDAQHDPQARTGESVMCSGNVTEEPSLILGDTMPVHGQEKKCTDECVVPMDYHHAVDRERLTTIYQLLRSRPETVMR